MAVYKMTDKEGKLRIVDANSKIEAINHVYEPLVTPLKPSEVVALMRGGAEVEEAA